MPENEFELYLSLLSRFLRLKPAQHGEIADELRDHLEARLEELTAQGLARDEAIRRALDEFGDAAELANHFAHLAHVRKRRLIMRFTFGTVAALAASLLVATAFWPETRQAPSPQRAVAQIVASGGRSGAPAAEKPTPAVGQDDKKAIEAKLSKDVGKLEFSEVPLCDVLERMSDLIEADILLDTAGISDAGIASDTGVNLRVRHASLSARVALDLLLEPLKLSYTVRDGLIMVTTAEHANQILVYNVNDLARPGMEGAGAAGVGSAPLGMRLRVPLGGGLGGAIAVEGGQGGLIVGSPVVRETNSLADLIAVTIDPASWDSAGGHGSIVQYADLLVVKNSQTVHGKIKVLLDMLRTSSAEGPVAAGASRH